mgnify:FL=1
MRRSNFVGFSPGDILGFFPSSSKKDVLKSEVVLAKQGSSLVPRLCLLISPLGLTLHRSTSAMNFSLLSSNDVKADEVLQITQVSVSVWKDDAVHKSSRADDDDYEKLAL